MEEKPPTPGMKYRHYSPTAQVVLFETTSQSPTATTTTSSPTATKLQEIERKARERLQLGDSVGIIATSLSDHPFTDFGARVIDLERGKEAHAPVFTTSDRAAVWVYRLGKRKDGEGGVAAESDNEAFAAEVAKGLFAALRALDSRGVGVILVEGIDEAYTGYAVMNRLRKAASETVVTPH